ncbi:MAG: ABC transporter ATP-binding protein [Lachnospiraceae bacterium]|nr:ABC transporter ATP-binding protein [Lachnospiraceae bacterium]
MKAFSCENVKSAYDKKYLDSHPIISDITFDIDEGSSVAVLGSNGCGKSTLLRTLAGMIPFSGDIRVGGRELSHLKRKEIASSVALMSQISQVYFSYSVFDTVLMGRFAHGNDLFGGYNDEDRTAAEEALKRTGALHMADRNLSELSGGELQRVFLARTFAQETPILMLDEPMNHLDLKVQAELSEYLKEWGQEEGHTLIGVYHDINLALRLSDTLIFMKNGKIVKKGEKKEILSYNLLQEVYDFDVYGYLRSLSASEIFD